ncbi:MAG: chitobiase/beta-hexosaminidase C-terminal domain-containing protein, partial [Bacteroidales bacterium]|nr:chitobiase/beta-hexosaminidase C-terminal domain-containing protein [Bacteroidales bacterium]
FVPAESLPLYAEAEGWKDLNLMPISQGVHKMTVNMPASADMKQLKDMSLELVNVKTGQTRRYVLTNRTQYTFTNLIENTLYNVYIRNAREDILATIEAVNIEKQDVQVSFADLKPLRDVTLRLTAPDGFAVGIDAFTVTWTDAVGNYLAKGATLPAQVEGTKAIAHVKLGQKLGTQYLQPADTTIVVGNMGTVGIRLMPLTQTELTGTVTAAATGLPIRNANISVTQQLNGIYPVTLTTTTDKDGHWALTAYAAPTTVTMQASGYVPQTVALESLPYEGRLEGALADLTGTTVSLDLYYRPAVREGEELTSDDTFSGYADISYAVYDETHQQDIADITVENGRIVLNGLDLAEGTRLRVTAKSLTGLFGDVTAVCTVNAGGKATATLPLTEYGSLIATFNETENLSVTGMLFKASGEFVARGFYQTTEDDDKPTLTFNCVPDGRYLLITMGESRLYNSFATLGALIESGLKSKVDYVGDNIEIVSGRIDSINNQSVPTFDETVYYATGPNTRLTVNKSQVTVGNYVTLRAQVDFKQGITPSDVQLLFDLPDGCSLVEGSVMAGNQLGTYEVDGNRVIVPVDYSPLRGTEEASVRFCIIPTAEGYYEPTASVSFSNGSTVMQPIGSIAITAEALRIEVPERSPKGKVPVSGVAPASSQVQVYDGSVLIGQAKANPNGTWSLTCMLNNPYNLSQHTVYAVVTNTDGITMQTETRNVTVSYGTLVPVVHGTFFNKYHSKSENIKWDFRDNTVSQNSYGWPTNDDNVSWSFTIDFKDGDQTANDTTVISNVVLYVLCSDDTYVALDAKFSTKSKRWVAQHAFNHDASPANVCVDFFVQNETIMADRQQMDDMMDEMKAFIAESQQAVKDSYHNFDDLLDEIEDSEATKELEQLLNIEDKDERTMVRIDSIGAAIAGGSVDIDANTKQILSQVDELLSMDNLDYETLQQVDALMAPLIEKSLSEDEEQEAELESLLRSADDELADFNNYVGEMREAVIDILSLFYLADTTTVQLPTGDMEFTIHADDKDKLINVKHIADIDVEQLLADGFQECPMTDGTILYYRYEPNAYCCIDTKSGTRYSVTIIEKEVSSSRQLAPRNGPNWKEWLTAALDVKCLANLGKAGKSLVVAHEQMKGKQGDWDFMSTTLTLVTEEFNNIRGYVECVYDNAMKEFRDRVEKDYYNQRQENAQKRAKAELKEKDLRNKYKEVHKEWRRKQSEVERLKKEINGFKGLVASTSDRAMIATWEKEITKKQLIVDSYEAVIKTGEKNLKSISKAVGKMVGLQSKYTEAISKLINEEMKVLKIIELVPSTMNEAISGSKTVTQYICEGAKWVGTAFSVVLQLIPLTMDAIGCVQDIGAWLFTAEPILRKFPCEDNADKLWSIWWDYLKGLYIYGGFDISQVGLDIAGLVIDSTPEAPGVGQWWVSLATDIASGLIGIFNPEKSAKAREDLLNRLNSLKCKKPKDKDKPVKVGNPSKPKAPSKTHNSNWNPGMNTKSIYDPSGFVYEAVESNRLEGVTATCYYKEEVEDMYGDLHENIMVWDAEEYAQRNPLFTDAEGKYAWDVPTGLWQVKFEKDGYETACSEWLPVPPPQLEVNVGMKQLRQPAVSHVKVCTDGIDITFDKYMDPQTLTTENIFVTKGGQTVDGKIELLNAEGGYASKLRFNASLTANDKLQLTIRHTVESYAGLQMEQDFTQQFDVEQRITAIVADSIVNLSEGSEYTVNVSILPAEAAKGKTLTATALTDDVVTVTPNGNGAFTLTANSLGQSAVRFTLTDDAELTATTTVIVRNPALMYVYAPRSSRMSGTEIYRGAEIRLTCQTAGATILYTLDGSCPCDAQNANVMTYTSPITATGEELTIRAMAVANGMAESDVVEFRYKVIDNPVSVEPILLSPFTLRPSPTEYYR